MISKTFEYDDYNGVHRKETHWFHLKKSELIDMEASEYGGMSQRLKRLSESIDVPEAMKIFKDTIKRAYGVKSDDGRGFIKSEEIFKDFESTEMYSMLYMELLTNVEFTLKFFKGIMPVMTAEQDKEFNKKIAELGIDAAD